MMVERCIWLGSDGKQFSIDRHSDDGVCAKRVERIHLLLVAYATGDYELALREGPQPCCRRHGKALHQSLAVNVGI